MKLLVVTPTLGRSPWLEAAVTSVARHAGGAAHVLIAPAGVERDLARRFPRTQVRAETRGGLYAAVNEAAAGDWDSLTYLNDDDTLEPGFAQVRSFVASVPAIVFGDVRYIDASGRDLGRMPSAKPAWVPALLGAGRAPFTQQGTTIPRATWTQLRGFDLQWHLAADYDFWCRAAAGGARFVRVRDTVASFRLHNLQLSTRRNEMAAEIAAIRARHAAVLEGRSPAGARWWFRWHSLARLWERRRRAGVWTSEALYARHSRGA